MNREGLSPHARGVLLGDRRCIATSKGTGERCKRAPCVGAFVCADHGGKTPLSMQAAKERLLILVEPALEVLFRATRQAPPCKHCGRSDADRDPTAVKAACMILDRTGFHPSLTVEHETPPPPSCVAWIPDERLQIMTSWMAEARAAMERNEPRAIDAVTVDAVRDEGDVDDDNKPGPLRLRA